MNFTDLYELERQARKEGKVEDLKSIFLKMIQLCGDDREVISLIRVLSARRGQDRNAIKWLVSEVYQAKRNSFPDNWTDFAKGLLSEVVEGKMFMEAERIELTSDLKSEYERKGLKREALEVVMDVPVETFTMIPESTIMRYQLEQFRLCVELKDWVRSDITMKKIRKKYFVENEAQEEEVLFYKYIVDLFLGQEKFFDASSTYKRLSDIVDSYKAVNESKQFTVLASFFGIICTCEGEKGDVRESKSKYLEDLAKDKNNEEGMRLVLDRFLSSLVIEKEAIGGIQALVSKYLPDVERYTPYLILAIDEHNFFIVERFYSTISLETCSRLLDVDTENLLNRISFMVNSGFSSAKINQREGVIVFGGKKWNSEVGEVLNKIIRVDHMIHKEKLKKIVSNEK